MKRSGNNDAHHRNGVSIIVAPDVDQVFINVVQHSDRIMMINNETTAVNLNIKQAYAPTQYYTDEIIEKFYEELQLLLTATKNMKKLLMGDFNATIGKRQCEEVIQQRKYDVYILSGEAICHC